MTKRISKLILVLVSILLFLPLGCGFGARVPKSLLVHCGAGIKPPMDELGDLFYEKHGVKVEYSYKGSGCLLADIALSRRGDLYMPGEIFYMT